MNNCKPNLSYPIDDDNEEWALVPTAEFLIEEPASHNRRWSAQELVTVQAPRDPTVPINLKSLSESALRNAASCDPYEDTLEQPMFFKVVEREFMRNEKSSEDTA